MMNRNDAATAFTVSSAALPVDAVFVSVPAPAPIAIAPVGAAFASVSAPAPVAAVPVAAVFVSVLDRVLLVVLSCFPFEYEPCPSFTPVIPPP